MDVERHGIEQPLRNNKCGDSATFSPLQLQQLFQPIENDPPMFPVVSGHPIKPKGLNQTRAPIQTNRFYTNLFLGDQHQPIYTIPYSIAWTGCSEAGLCHHGIGISNTERYQLKYGPGDPAEYFYSPTNIHSLVLSAVDIGVTARLDVKSLTSGSVTVLLSSPNHDHPILEMPVVQGMGFITANYFDSSPILGSLVGIQRLVLIGKRRAEGMAKYSITLIDETKWLMYIFASASGKLPSFTETQKGAYVSTISNFTGTIQIAKEPQDVVTNAYDAAAGVYATDMSLEGSINGDDGKYTIKWEKGGRKDRTLLMFLLPHHLESLTDEDRNKTLLLNLQTTTKGVASGILADKVSFAESDLPSSIGLHPWLPGRQQQTFLNNVTRLNFIHRIAEKDLSSDILGRLEQEQSVYWAGKVRAVFVISILLLI